MECSEFNPGKSQIKQLSDDTPVSFIPMECVGTDGSIDVTHVKTLGEVRKGYTYFRDNDVVFAKITPCFENGKVAIARGCTNGIGFGTTEFHVARPIPGKTNAIWLKHLLKSDSLRHLASSNMSGTAGQRRIQQPFFEKLSIGLPPIELQDSFAAFVEQVDKSKLIFEQEVSRFDELVKSRFNELFKSCNKVSLGEIADITMGQSPESSSYNDKGEGVPFFQGKTEFGETFVKINKYCSNPKKIAKPMDILISVRAPVGAVNITESECCIGRGLASIRPKPGKADVWFLFFALKTIEKEISAMGVGSTFTAIGKNDLKKITIPNAFLEDQRKFSQFIQQIVKSKSLLLESIKKIIPDY